MSTAASEIRALTIGSRGSPLALWQARHVASYLQGIGVNTRIEIIRTTGDHLQTASLTQAGGKGLFTKEIEDALLAGAIDAAVHSLKDLPTENPRGLTIAAVPTREDPRDALVGRRLDELVPGSRVGTSSGRRAAQLRLLRSDLLMEAIRGNVDTRIRKQKEGLYDAVVLAAAGLRRLGLEHEITQTFSPEEICPAPGQGALAIQTRADDPAREICSQLNDDATFQAVNAERTVLEALGGGCQLPVGAFARVIDDAMELMAVVISPDGSRHLKGRREGRRTDAQALGRSLAEELLARGARAILGAVE